MRAPPRRCLLRYDRRTHLVEGICDVSSLASPRCTRRHASHFGERLPKLFELSRLRLPREGLPVPVRTTRWLQRRVLKLRMQQRRLLQLQCRRHRGQLLHAARRICAAVFRRSRGRDAPAARRERHTSSALVELAVSHWRGTFVAEFARTQLRDR